MSCDLSDPAISIAYNEIVTRQPTNWLILGYNETRDVISLYSKGTQGLSELRANLREEVLYGFVRIDDRYILITYVSEQVSGVRRARALVHGRAVGALFKAHNAQITASNSTDLSDSNIRTRLKLGSDSPRSSTSERGSTTPTASRSQSPISPRPQSPSTSRRHQGSVSVAVPSPPQSPAAEGPPSYAGNTTTAGDKAPTTPASVEEAQRLEVERRAHAETERLEEEEAERRLVAEAEKKAHETERLALLQREEANKAAAIKQIEAEKRAKEEAARIQAENLKKQFLDSEKSGKGTILSGFVTVQGGQTPFWKRRWFTIKAKMLFLYRDEMDKLPITSIDLSSTVLDIDDENLMPYSFTLVVRKEPYVFFSDSQQDHQAIVTLLRLI